MHSIQYNCVINGNQFLIYATLKQNLNCQKLTRFLNAILTLNFILDSEDGRGILRHPIPLRYNAAKAPMNRVMLQITFTLITRPNHPIQNKRAVDKVIMISMKEANSFTKYRRQK